MFKKIFIITLLTASAFAVMNANAALSSGLNDDGLTLTPYGWAPKSRVIAVPSNESIGISAEGNLVLKDRKTGSIIREYAKVDTKTLTSFDSQRNIKNLPGHIAEYNVTAPAKDISFFTTSWIVPKKPKNPKAPDAAFFIFSGISDNMGGTLLSTLKWGVNVKGGDDKGYQILNWVYDNGYYVHGPSVSVSPGNKLTTTILRNRGLYGWNYSEKFTGYPQADLNYVSSYNNPIVPAEVIEDFLSNTANLDELPASLCTKMKDIYVIGKPAVSKLNWKIDKGDLPLVTPSGKNVVIVNNSGDKSLKGEIDFYFH